MREVGRNDPCPCGSGRKHKRCCLDADRSALRLAERLERRIDELGERAIEEHQAAWVSEFERNLGPLPPFGPHIEDAAWLDTWLVCDAPVVDRRTPLEAWAQFAADAQLARSAICGWWVRSVGPPIAATHWRYEEPVALHCQHRPFGELEQGALLVARGIEAGLGHVALIGRPVVVEDDAVGDVLAVLHRAPDEALCAALRWPEERTYTAEGELVRQRFRRYALDDPDTAIAVLRATPRFTEDTDVLTYWDDDVEFKVAASAIREVTTPPAERGVVWALCEEDTTDPPLLGEVTVSREDSEVALSAPTQRRLERLVAALPDHLRASLGEVTDEHSDFPDVLPRLRRVRMDELTSLPTARPPAVVAHVHPTRRPRRLLHGAATGQ